MFKKFLKILTLIFIGSILSATAAFALIALPVNQGGTGITTLTGIPYGTGTAGFSQVTIGSGLTFSGGTLTSTGGAGTPGTPVNSVQFNSASAFAGDSNFLWDNTNKQLQLGGTSGFSATTNTPLSLAGTINTYLQSYIQNKSNGTSATSDYIAGADNDGVALTGHYSDMGINSSGWTKAGNPIFNAEDPNDGYFITSGGNQNIGTDGSLIRFLQGGFATANEVGRLSSSGLTVGLPGTLTGAISFAGSGSSSIKLQGQAFGSSSVLTLPAATDTLVARSTTDILTNKTLSGNTATNLISGSGTLTLNTSGTITVPSATDTLAALGISQAFTGTNTFNKPSIGTAATDAVILQNATAAAVGAQQFSPVLHFISNGWKTTATAASQQTDFLVQGIPIQNAANPESTLIFTPKINGTTSSGSLGICARTTANAGNINLTGLDGGSNTPQCDGGVSGWSGFGSMNAGSVFGIFNNGTAEENLNVNGIGMGNTKQIMWFSGAAGNAATGDTGIVRNGAGVLEINNGTSGTFADLKLRNIAQTGKTTTYNNIATVSNGTPSELGTADLTAQSAAVAATTIYTPAASGMFRVSVVLQVTTAASTSSVLGGTTGVVITYTEPDGSVAQSVIMALDDQGGSVVSPASGNTNNTTAASSHGQLVIDAKTGVAVQYAIGYTSIGVTPMQYSAHLKIEAL